MSTRGGKGLFLATTRLWARDESSVRAWQSFGAIRLDVQRISSMIHIYRSLSSHDASNGQLPAPGAPLRKALVHEAMSFQNLLSRKEDGKHGPYSDYGRFKRPPWKEPESVTRLTKALETYRVDLSHGKNCPPGSQPAGDALPFLEDTITHLVGRERNSLVHSASKLPPSRIRAVALEEALAASNGTTVGNNHFERHSDGPTWAYRQQEMNTRSSLIYQANRIISIIAVIERVVPLTNEQRVSIGHAVAQVSDRFLTPSSVWKALQTLLYLCYLDEDSVADIISKHPCVASTQISMQGIVDCLHLLELDDASLSGIVRAYPEIFFLDPDTDMLPTLAYLSDLGLDELEMADIIKSHPSVFKPGNMSKLQSGVAFWTGKGLSRKSIVNLIKVDPTILETNKVVMQMKVDWLTDHTGLTLDEIAFEPRLLSSNLGSLVAPRIVFAAHSGKHVSSFSDTQSFRDFFKLIVDPSPRGYLEYLSSSLDAYESYIDEWYSTEFIPWLERKSRISEILLQEENEASDLSFDSSDQDTLGDFAASKELAWEQQLERDREWHMAWHAWKREQQSLAVAERTLKRQEERINPGRNDWRPPAAATAFKSEMHSSSNDDESKSHAMNLQGRGKQNLLGSPDRTDRKSKDHSNDVHDLWRQSASRNNCRSVFFLSRKWTCDSMIDEALDQAIIDSQEMLEPKNDFDADNLEYLSTERVQSCAVSLLLLLRASDHGVLEPKVFNSWAARSGVDATELIAAKALISLSNAAHVRSEPSWKYHSVPPKVWRLRDSGFYAPNLLPSRDTRGSRNVSDLADLIYRSLKETPEEPMTRMEISNMYDNRPEFHTKRMRFAIGVLLEQGMVIQRRRKGIASGPMELVLTEPMLHAVLNQSKL